MDLNLDGKVALVTGASKNLGRQIAIELASEGMHIIAVARDGVALDNLLEDLDGNKNNHSIISLDLMSNDGVAKLFLELGRLYLVPDVVIHNLGGSLQITDPLVGIDQWMRVWKYNIGIAIEINNRLIPSMVERGFGRIVHVSTLSTQSQQGYAPYVSAKYALEGYVRTVSQTVSKNNVVINAVAPGLLDIEDRYFGRMKRNEPSKIEEYYSNFLPIHRMGTLQEIAKLITFMASDYSGFMPGSIVRIDGGGR